jgi:hypothetical protein
MFLNFSYIIGIRQGVDNFLNNLPLLNIKECQRKINVKYTRKGLARDKIALSLVSARIGNPDRQRCAIEKKTTN